MSLIILMTGWFYCGYTVEDSISTRLDLLSSSLILPAILVVMLVINDGSKRFDDSAAFRDDCSDDSIRIHQSILTNIIEQSLIFFMFLIFLYIQMRYWAFVYYLCIYLCVFIWQSSFYLRLFYKTNL